MAAKKSVKYIKAYPEVMERVKRIWANNVGVENGTLAKILGEWKQDRLRLCIPKDVYDAIMLKKVI